MEDDVQFIPTIVQEFHRDNRAEVVRRGLLEGLDTLHQQLRLVNAGHQSSSDLQETEDHLAERTLLQVADGHLDQPDE